MLAGLKRFDIHSKSIEGVKQQTVLGALLTVITALLVLVLIVSEFSNFLRVEVVSRMAIDKSANVEAVKIDFDVSFPRLSCERLSFVQEVTRGAVHVHEPVEVSKESLQSSGCRITGQFLTDKSAGNFRFGVQPSGRQNERGELLTDFDLSHSVTRLAFLPTIGPLATEKLPHLPTSIVRDAVDVPADSSIFQYAVQVVPTEYKTVQGDLSFLNQYSVNEKVVNSEPFARNEALGSLNVRDFYGLVVSYDFNPVKLFMEERRERIIDFVSNLFGIVGGVITVLGLVEGVLHQSAKALIGKKD